MKTSNNGIELIKRFEGYRSQAYKCPAGVWTCGYGHTSGVSRDTVCTESIATEWLKKDVSFAEDAVNRELPQLSQSQFDALVSFVFNLGSSAFRGSTLCRLARIDPYDPRIRAEFGKWVNIRQAGKLVPSEGLRRRRSAEAEMYFT